METVGGRMIPLRMSPKLFPFGGCSECVAWPGSTDKLASFGIEFPHSKTAAYRDVLVQDLANRNTLTTHPTKI